MSFSPGQVKQAQQHLHDTLLAPSLKSFDATPTTRNDAWPGGTPNMHRTGQVLLYVDRDLDAGLLAFLDHEATSGGFELNEPFPATHDHLNYGAMGVTLKVAIDRRNAEITDAVTSWFRHAFYLCRLLDATPKYGPWGPGARASDGGPLQGSNMGRTLAFNAAYGAKMRPKQAADKGNTGALAISMLPDVVRRTLTADGSDLKLAVELHVASRDRRFHGAGDYVAWFPQPIPGALDVAVAAGVWDSKPWASRDVDAAVEARIAECGDPVVVPGVKSPVHSS